MKHKVKDLEGRLLDSAVAMCEGIEDIACLSADFVANGWTPYEPSSAWEHGGPIIARERIHLHAPVERVTALWAARLPGGYGEAISPLVAAMRAYVASKFGKEVDIP